MDNAKRVYDFLEEAGTFYLATVEGDQPRVRPYGAQLFYEGSLYLMSFGETAATRQIAQNPKAELCAFKGQTLRVACVLIEDQRPVVKKALAEKMPSLKPLLGENGEKGVMYKVTDATATFFKLMEPVETINF